MLRTWLAVILLLCTAARRVVWRRSFLKKIRIASKAAGESLVPYVVSQRLGFYREEGLDVDVIVTRGHGDDSGGCERRGGLQNGGSIPAMLGGARLKILQVSTDKPSQYLVVSPKITNIKQLSRQDGRDIRCFRQFHAVVSRAIEQKWRRRGYGADARSSVSLRSASGRCWPARSMRR